ncbi:MAG: hypothetical protein Q9159_003039 [Coniocarpon cinnabarinum]
MQRSEEESLATLWDEARQRFYSRVGKNLQRDPRVTFESVVGQIDERVPQEDSKDSERKRTAKKACIDALSCIKLLGGVAAQGASQSALDKFKSLIDRQSKVESTLTLETAMANGSHLKQLREAASETGEKIDGLTPKIEEIASSEKERRSDRAKNDRLKNIDKKLQIDVGKDESAKRLYLDTLGHRLEGTGLWLSDQVDYSAWLRGSRPLLRITGKPNTGKSLLVASIIHELEAQAGSSSNGSKPFMVVHHFFDKSFGIQKKGGDDDHLLKAALKCMIRQVADSDDAFAKGFGKAIELSSFKCDAFRSLFATFAAEVRKRDVRYFIVLDGLEQVSASSLKEFLEALNYVQTDIVPHKSPMSVLLSGDLSSFKPEICEDIPSINIEKLDSTDVCKIVQKQLRDEEILQEAGAEITNLRDSIPELIADNAGGDFFRARDIVNQIKPAIDQGDPEEIKKIIRRAGQEEFDATRFREKLAENLSAADIEELNILLAWCIFGGPIWPQVDELQAALKLKEKYGQIFRLSSDSKLALVSVEEEMGERLMIGRTKQRVENATKVDVSITIKDADVQTVQSFLWAFTEKAMVGDFNFDSTSPHLSKPRVGVNGFDAHVEILMQDFEVLENDAEENVKPLVSYILCALPGLLNILWRDLESYTLSEEVKAKLIGKLHDLFIDASVFERHLDHIDLLAIAEHWMSGPECPPDIPAFWTWLDHKETNKHLSKNDRKSLNELSAATNRNQSLVKPMAELMARHWLQDDQRSVGEVFGWLDLYLKMSPEHRCQSVDEEDSNAQASPSSSTDRASHVEKASAENQDDITVPPVAQTLLREADPNGASQADVDGAINHQSEDVSDSSMPDPVDLAQKLAQELLGVDEEQRGHLWHRRLGETYLQCDEPQPPKAVAAFRTAQSLDDHSWKIFRGLAHAYAASEDYSASIDIMPKAIALLQDDNSVGGDTQSQEHVACILFLADNHCLSGSAAEAVNVLQDALQLSTGHTEIQATLLKLLIRGGNEQQVRELWPKISDELRVNLSQEQTGGIFEHLSEEWDFDELFELLLAFTSGTPIFDDVIDLIREAVRIAEQQQFVLWHAPLLFSLGVAYYHYKNAQESDVQEACDLWHKCAGLSLGNSDTASWQGQFARQKSIRNLSSHYYNQIRASNEVEEAVENLIFLDNMETSRRSSRKRLGTYLASYFARVAGDLTQARKYFTEDMKTAMALLTDDESENDMEGFYNLATVFIPLGDDVNACTAMSMMRPAVDPYPLYCDGFCGKSWRTAEDMYFCKICPDVQLCPDCHQKVKTGTMKRLVCNSKHDWLFFPPLDYDEVIHVQTNMIKAGGKMEEGTRVGGQWVPWAEWLNGVREEWGV